MDEDLHIANIALWLGDGIRAAFNDISGVVSVGGWTTQASLNSFSQLRAAIDLLQLQVSVPPPPVAQSSPYPCSRPGTLVEVRFVFAPRVFESDIVDARRCSRFAFSVWD